MPKKRIADLVRCKYFEWRVKRRGRTFVADGRSNQPAQGRYSLDADNLPAARQALEKLDLLCAIRMGKASPQEVTQEHKTLTLAEGSRRYQEHVARPSIVGGARSNTRKRYRAVFDKFLKFTAAEGLQYWNQITRNTLESYAAFLDDDGYAYATEYLELTTLKQAMKWFVESDLLPATCLFRLPISKPQGTTTYCWRPEEVVAIIQHCHQRDDLHWLWRVVVGLTCTGLRISELAALRWSDIDFDQNVIRITDETAFSRKSTGSKIRQTKTGRSRTFPIVGELRRVLDQVPRHSDGIVYHGPLGGALKPDTVRRILVRDVLTPLEKRFPKPIGAPVAFSDGRLHSFRHYFCSVCARSVSEQVAMNWLGHSSSKMLRHYFHLHDREAQTQMRKLDFFGVTGATSAPGQSSSV